MKLYFLLFTLLCFHSIAYTQIVDLVKEKPIIASIEGGEQHEYKLVLGKNRFISLEVLQQGVDVIVYVEDSDGNIIGRYDSPNGEDGPEKVLFSSTTKGSHIIIIRPFETTAPKGEYTIRLNTNEDVGKTIDHYTDQLMYGHDSLGPGASIAVVKDGKLEFSKGYGLANLEYNILNEPSTVFHIASVSKQFTAFAVLLLEEQGKLSIDDDIRKYIPEMPDFGDTITLRHLANHTSGLRDQWNLLTLAGWRFDDLITTGDILNILFNQRELNFNPGDERVYCNSGFTLLAEVVARVSGMTFAEFTQKYMFEPLGMSYTLFYDDHEKIVKNRAYSYYADPSTGFYKKSILNYANVGATSLFTTVEDMAKWTLNFESPIIGGPTLFETMKTPAVLNNGDSIEYAMGQVISEMGGLPNFAHSGVDAGYRTFVTRYPEQNLSVIVFANSAEFEPANIGGSIALWYLRDEFKSKKKIDKEEEFRMTPTLFENYSGRYTMDSGIVVDVFAENDRYYCQVMGQDEAEMFALNDYIFDVPSMKARIDFIKNKSGEYYRLQLTANNKATLADRNDPFDADSVHLKEYLGTFFSEELSASYDLLLVDGMLTISHRKLGQFPLVPLREDQFYTDYWLFSKIRFLRNESGEITSLKISNERSRNMRFVKVEK